MATRNYTAREFTAVLTELRGGLCEQELREELQKVTAACIDTGKSGSVTLKLTVVPQGSGQAVVKDDIKSAVPVFTVQPTVMFVDDDKNLRRTNPQQMNLTDVIRVNDEDSTISVNAETGEIVKATETGGGK